MILYFYLFITKVDIILGKTKLFIADDGKTIFFGRKFKNNFCVLKIIRIFAALKIEVILYLK
jgi:hypothetical protein